MIDHPLFRSVNWLAIAGLAAAGAYLLSVDIAKGMVLLGLAVAGGIALRFQRGLPSGIMLLLIIAVTVNAAGYIVGLWHERTMFDELVHAFTTFAGMTALIWMFTKDGRLYDGASTLAILASALIAGVILGLAWEGFEWLIGIIGHQRDTVVDLVMDSIGAVAAGLFVLFIKRGQFGVLGRPQALPSAHSVRHRDGR